MVRDRYIPVLILSFSFILLAAACSGSNDTDAGNAIQPDTTQSSGSSDSDQPPSDASGSGNSDGGRAGTRDYPLDVPDGTFRDVHVEVGIPQDSQGLLLYPSDDFDRIVSFYENWVAEHPDEWARVELDDQLTFVNSTNAQTVTIERDHEYQDEAYTLVQYGGFVDG